MLPTTPYKKIFLKYSAKARAKALALRPTSFSGLARNFGKKLYRLSRPLKDGARARLYQDSPSKRQLARSWTH